MSVIKIRLRNDPPMESMLVTVDNLAEVAKWSGGTVVGEDIGRPRVQLVDERDADYAGWAELGEYVIRGCTGMYWATNPEQFEKDYLIVDE